jgi:imidazolonepropionase-like amidohydrolase
LKVRSYLPSLVTACLLAAPAQGDERPPYAGPVTGTVTIYRSVQLIDGRGGPLQPDMAVIVDGVRIKEVVSDRALAPADLEGATVVDLGGRYLLPGLIDTHQHLATPPNRRRAEASMRRDLYGGVTAVRDMADDLRSIADLARSSLVGEIEGPDIVYAALMAGPSFFDDPRTQAVSQGVESGRAPWMQAIDDATDLPMAVTLARGTSASAIKIYANLAGDLVSRITAEAHRQHMPVWAHGMVFPATPSEVIDSGVDVVSHVCYLAYQAQPRRPESYQQRFPVDAANFAAGDNSALAQLFASMARRGTILDATNRVYLAQERAPGAKPPLCPPGLPARLTNQAFRAGVEISTGTDGSAPWDSPWPALYDELEFLVQRAGMPPAQVLRSATLNGARAAGRETEMGSIEAGKLANLVVLERNPLTDIANLRSVSQTIKRGRVFPRTAYRPITRDEMPEDDE